MQQASLKPALQFIIIITFIYQVIRVPSSNIICNMTTKINPHLSAFLQENDKSHIQ